MNHYLWNSKHGNVYRLHDIVYLQALNFKKYTTASDVWSYGIVMYEIWSLGHKPYEGYNNPQVSPFRPTGPGLVTHFFYRPRVWWREENGLLHLLDAPGPSIPS